MGRATNIRLLIILLVLSALLAPKQFSGPPIYLDGGIIWADTATADADVGGDGVAGGQIRGSTRRSRAKGIGLAEVC